LCARNEPSGNFRNSATISPIRLSASDFGELSRAAASEPQFAH